MEIDIDEAQEDKGAYSEIFGIASAMFSQDRIWLTLTYPLLIIPALFALFNLSAELLFVALLVERLLQLSFLYLLVRRWYKKLQTFPSRIHIEATLRFFFMGVAIWIFLVLPLVFGMTSTNEVLTTGSFLMVGAGAFLAFRYFFYPVPTLIGIAPLGTALDAAINISRGRPFLPLQLFLAPLGIMSCLVALALAPFPDGRVPFFVFLAEALSAVSWVFLSYLTLAASLLRLERSYWREAGLDPYRTARLATLELQGSSWLARQLRPMHGLGWLLISALLWLGNLARMFTMAPAAEIRIESLIVQDSTVRIQAVFHDPIYEFHGLQPVGFRLAGPEGTAISSAPREVYNLENSRSLLYGFPSSASPLRVAIVFDCTRSGEALTRLKDLHLWYRSAKLQQLDMSQNTGVGQNTSPKNTTPENTAPQNTAATEPKSSESQRSTNANS